MSYCISYFYPTLLIEGVSPQAFMLLGESGEPVAVRYGANFSVGTTAVLITAPEPLTAGTRVITHLRSPQKVANALATSLTIAQIKKTNAVTLSLKETNTERGVAILAELVRQHNLDKVEYDRRVGERTNSFIVDRLAIIDTELTQIESSAEQFKRRNEITDIPREAELLGTNREKMKEQSFALETESQNFLNSNHHCL